MQQILEPMNILMNSSQKIQFGDDYYDTSSIIGNPPSEINIENDEDKINISVIGNSNKKYI